jgi:hypothetical protein
MFQKIGFYMLLSLLIIMYLSCASWKKENTNHHQPHEHEFPFTKVMGDYHLRLQVDHINKEMMLIFEDIVERPVKIVDLRQINGEIIFHNGTTKQVTFYPQEPIMRKHITHREAGIYVERGEWIGSTPALKLHIKVPFEGKEYDFTYDYEVPGGKIEIPYHRGY